MGDAALWATAVYVDDDGDEFTAPALVAVRVNEKGRQPMPVAWDLDSPRPKLCRSWPNFVRIEPLDVVRDERFGILRQATDSTGETQ